MQLASGDEKTSRKWIWLYAEAVAKLDRKFVCSFDRRRLFSLPRLNLFLDLQIPIMV